MDPQALPLRDIHLPPPASWWPLAPLTWLLIALLLLIVCSVIWQLTGHGRRTRYRWIRAWYSRQQQFGWRRVVRQRLKELRVQYRQSGDGQALVSGLSTLLRRALISQIGRHRAAASVGDDWLRLLDADDPDRPFSTGVGRVFEHGPYQPATATSGDSAEPLLRLVEQRLLGKKTS
ncbi:MAG: DUF4381 domain-containing protein [Pseudomonadota bacterium]